MTSRTRVQIYEDLKDLRRRGAVSDRVLEAVAAPCMLAGLEVRALADRVFGDEAKAEAWLSRSNASLAGQRPCDLLTDELGAAVVRETLEQIDHGIFA